MHQDEQQSRLALMDADERARAAGAILFVASEPVSLSIFARHLGCSISQARSTLGTVSESFAKAGLVLQWPDNDHVQLGTSADLASVVRQFLGQERTFRLSQAALETVALIAYRQPVTRSDIEAVRGVDSSGVLQTLLARGVIEAVGRLPTIGTPLIYSTTPEFLRLFGLQTLEELPRLPDDLVAMIDERGATDLAESSSTT